VVLPDGRRVCSGTRFRKQSDAEEVLVLLKIEAYEHLLTRGIGRVGNLPGSIDAWTREVDSSLTSYWLIDIGGLR